MPPNGTLTSGVGTFHATFTKVAPASANFKIGANDTITGMRGTSSATAVTP